MFPAEIATTGKNHQHFLSARQNPRLNPISPRNIEALASLAVSVTQEPLDQTQQIIQNFFLFGTFAAAYTFFLEPKDETKLSLGAIALLYSFAQFCNMNPNQSAAAIGVVAGLVGGHILRKPIQ